MGFLAGKRILITGLLSNRSIAYGIAKAMHREGAELAFTYQNDRFKDRVAKFATEFGSDLLWISQHLLPEHFGSQQNCPRAFRRKARDPGHADNPDRVAAGRGLRLEAGRSRRIGRRVS